MLKAGVMQIDEHASKSDRRRYLGYNWKEGETALLLLIVTGKKYRIT